MDNLFCIIRVFWEFLYCVYCIVICFYLLIVLLCSLPHSAYVVSMRNNLYLRRILSSISLIYIYMIISYVMCGKLIYFFNFGCRYFLYFLIRYTFTCRYDSVFFRSTISFKLGWLYDIVADIKDKIKTMFWIGIASSENWIVL